MPNNIVKFKYLICLLFLILPITGLTQVSLHEISLPQKMPGIGIAYKEEKVGTGWVLGQTRSFSGNLNYGFMPNTRAFLNLGISKTSIPLAEAFDTDIKPSPFGNLGVIYIKRLQESNINWFINSSLGAEYVGVDGIDYNGIDYTYRATAILYEGSVGILYRLNVNVNTDLIPFIAVSYLNNGFNLSQASEFNEDFKKQVVYGQVGVAVELLSYISIIGKFYYPLTDTDSAFSIEAYFN